MRFLLLASALTLASCSDDCGSGASCAPVPFPDAGPADLGAADTGSDVLAVDVAEDRPAPLDASPADVGSDVGQVDAGADSGSDAGPLDVGALDVSQGDAGLLDVGAVDTGADSGSDAGALDVRAVDAGSDAGPADVGTDAGPGDTGSDVPADVRISCAGKLPLPCRTHDDCNVCIPGSFNERWCCAPLIGGGGECRVSLNPVCH